MAAGEVMQRQFDPAASSAALAAAQYWKEQQAESMQGERTVSISRILFAHQTSWHMMHACILKPLAILAGGSCWPGCYTDSSICLEW